jgi:hypothetical protein
MGTFPLSANGAAYGHRLFKVTSWIHWRIDWSLRDLIRSRGLTEDKAFSKTMVAAFKREKTDWYLWLAPAPPQECIDHGTNCPTWTRIDPL